MRTSIQLRITQQAGFVSLILKPHAARLLNTYPLLLTLAHRVNNTCQILLIDSSLLPMQKSMYIAALTPLQGSSWCSGETGPRKAASTNGQPSWHAGVYYSDAGVSSSKFSVMYAPWGHFIGLKLGSALIPLTPSFCPLSYHWNSSIDSPQSWESMCALCIGCVIFSLFVLILTSVLTFPETTSPSLAFFQSPGLTCNKQGISVASFLSSEFDLVRPCSAPSPSSGLFDLISELLLHTA